MTEVPPTTNLGTPKCPACLVVIEDLGSPVVRLDLHVCPHCEKTFVMGGEETLYSTIKADIDVEDLD